jgi:hypothetical protein
MPQLPRKLPHLNGAIGLVPIAEGKGMCFHRSVGFVLDVPPAKLAVGVLRAATDEELMVNPAASQVPFIHCWAEIGSSVYAPTTIEAQGGRLRPFKRAEYYQQNGVHNVSYMSRRTLRQLSDRYGLSDHLIYHTPVRDNAKFGAIILDALGVEHILNAGGGLLPGG